MGHRGMKLPLMSLLILIARPYYWFMCDSLYIYQEDIYDELSLPSETTAAELFRALDSYVSRHLNWFFCVCICTDGAAAMTGHISGLIARVKEVAPKCETIHCVVHREMLASRRMLRGLSKVLNDVTNINNYIKTNA